MAVGEVTWVGVEPLGERDGRVALFLTDHLPRLWRPRSVTEDLGDRERAILTTLERQGASFFAALHASSGEGFPGDTVDALWALVWRGLVTNDSLHALRAFTRPPARDRRVVHTGRAFRSRRVAPPAGEGRWSLVAHRVSRPPSDTAWGAALAQQLLTRYGVVTREVVAAEGIAGGFSAVYDVLRSMEERGRIRRGFFASGVAALQFVMPAALDLLRSLRAEPEQAEVVVLAATDPANPYGALLKWPGGPEMPGRGPTRTVGARVVVVNGWLGAFVGRGGRPILAFLPEHEPERSTVGHAVAKSLGRFAREGEGRVGGLLVSEVNGAPAGNSPLAPFLLDAGFVRTAMGFQIHRERTTRTSV
jgi:ATP-dependent Lhr-like helicase